MMRACGVLFALTLMASPAQAQFGLSGDMPVNVEAEKATYQGGVTVLETNVRVRQDDTTVQSDRMDIFRDEEERTDTSASLNFGSIKRIEAMGSFRFQNPENIITGDQGTYYSERDIFIVTGNVVLTQPNGSNVRGSRLVYNLNTRSAKFGNPCETGTGERGECERVTFTLE